MVIDKEKRFLEIKKEFNNRNYILISTELNTVNDKLEYMCIKHKSHGIQKIKYTKFRMGQGCKYCSFEKLSNIHKHSYDKIKKAFENKNLILITNEYFNNRKKLEYICKKHQNNGIQTISYDSLQRGRGCYFCGREKIADSRRLDFDFVKTEFEKRNYTLLDDKYQNSINKLNYICNSHTDKIQQISYGKLQQGQGCYFVL